MSEKSMIGPRGSDLALWQANHIESSLENLFPENQFEIKIIHTTGDKAADIALSKIGDTNLFTRQIEAEPVVEIGAREMLEKTRVQVAADSEVTM